MLPHDFLLKLSVNPLQSPAVFLQIAESECIFLPFQFLRKAEVALSAFLLLFSVLIQSATASGLLFPDLVQTALSRFVVFGCAGTHLGKFGETPGLSGTHQRIFVLFKQFHCDFPLLVRLASL